MSDEVYHLYALNLESTYVGPESTFLFNVCRTFVPFLPLCLTF